jgi:FixJ family two-component response regulator
VSVQFLIAVIDDDESFRLALIESLSSFGYDADGFASADEFVAAGEPERYRCIVTDVHMPGLSGIALKRLLNARDCQVPVIMITARGELDLEIKAAAAGAVCLLRKPFPVDALIGSVQSALNA